MRCFGLISDLSYSGTRVKTMTTNFQTKEGFATKNRPHFQQRKQFPHVKKSFRPHKEGLEQSCGVNCLHHLAYLA